MQRSNPAARLYERLGFQEVSGDDGEAVMVLPLGKRDEGAQGGAPFERARAARGVILGCTEIGLLVRSEDTGVPLFDTTLIHARGAALKALED